MSGRLAGRTALITGGTSGLGADLAALFREEGANVVFTGRDEARGAEVARRSGATFVRADAASPEAAEAAVRVCVERHGGIDVLVANAGVGIVQPLVDTSPEDWRRIWETNVSGYLYAAQAAMRRMRSARRPGSIVMIASDAGVWGERSIGAYSVSKAAVVMLSRVLALDGAPDGVRVNCVCPGYFEPGMRDFADRAGGTGYSDPPKPPLGRYGTARDMANAVLYFASDESAFSTGSVLLVEGGATAGLP